MGGVFLRDVLNEDCRWRVFGPFFQSRSENPTVRAKNFTPRISKIGIFPFTLHFSPFTGLGLQIQQTIVQLLTPECKYSEDSVAAAEVWTLALDKHRGR